jgi:cytochrome P450
MPETIDFTDPVIQADPYPVYARLRREAPVFWNGQHWLISRYDDVVGLLTDRRMSSQRVDATFRVLPEDVQQELAPLRHILNNEAHAPADAGDEGILCQGRAG